MTTNQKDLIDALKTVSPELATYAFEQFVHGATFDEVLAELNRAIDVVDGWRIGRGV
jgi:hypothetical protein